MAVGAQKTVTHHSGHLTDSHSAHLGQGWVKPEGLSQLGFRAALLQTL